MTAPSISKYLITDYQYHFICMSCGAIRHTSPGASPDECTQCGFSSWRTLGTTESSSEPWYMQALDPSCPICRRTANKLNSMRAQMALFVQE
jgi:ribosomal protein L37E